MRGDGRAFTRGGRWWIGFYVNGKQRREPARVVDRGELRPAKDEREALKALRVARTDVASGRYVPPSTRRTTVKEILDEYLQHQENQKRRAVKRLGYHLKPVREFFDGCHAGEVTTARIERYTKERLALGRAPATVNRELEGLRGAFRHAMRRTPPLVAAVPFVPMLHVENARQGFLSRADFEALVAKIDDADVRDYVAWLFWTGMRFGETSHLTWDMLDRETWTLRLHASAAKTGEGRTLALTGPLLAIIERRDQVRDLKCAYIFHRGGRRVRQFWATWAAACRAVGLVPGRKDGITPHDLRRTAVRNMVRAGVDPTVAMKVSGHKTPTMFRRYNIVSEEDLRLAMDRTAAYVASLPTERKVAVMGQREPAQNAHNAPNEQTEVDAMSDVMPVAISNLPGQAVNEGWCRRWDLNPH